MRVLGVLPEAELDDLYQAADVLLHAAALEGWGLSILEAMASGTSVVVSQGLPFEEYLDPVCATFVGPSSVTSIAQGLGRAYRRRGAVAEAAVARARAFSWENAATHHVELYEHVLAAHGRTVCTPPAGATPVRPLEQVLN